MAQLPVEKPGWQPETDWINPRMLVIQRAFQQTVCAAHLDRIQRKKMYQPIIIIGAARSGTNMLRDLLTQLPAVGTWPCDEINYIWRHGNADCKLDEFDPALATPSVQKYIRRAFDALAKRKRLKFVIEKTCANSLRVGFIDRVVPHAKYIFLLRDGRDAAHSALLRWKARLDLRYILKKTRYVPFSDLPYYAYQYLGNRIHRLVSQEKRLASWGPRFQGMQEMLLTQPLIDVCAAQWARSVNRARTDLERINGDRVHTIKYEQFTAEPLWEMTRLLEFLEIPVQEDVICELTEKVSNKSVGKWKQFIPDEDLKRIEKIMQTELEYAGYPIQNTIHWEQAAEIAEPDRIAA